MVERGWGRRMGSKGSSMMRRVDEGRNILGCFMARSIGYARVTTSAATFRSEPTAACERGWPVLPTVGHGHDCVTVESG